MRSEPLPRPVVTTPAFESSDVVTNLLALFDAAAALSTGVELSIYASQFEPGIAENALRVWASPRHREGYEVCEHTYNILGMRRSVRVTRDGVTVIRLLMESVS